MGNMAHKMKVTGKKYYIKTREKQEKNKRKTREKQEKNKRKTREKQRKNKKNKVKSTKNAKFIH